MDFLLILKWKKTDYKILDNPKEYILDKGGKIFVALYHGEPIEFALLSKPTMAIMITKW